MPAYIIGGDGQIQDYKPGMKLSAFGAEKKPAITDDEKGVRGPLVILQLGIKEGDWKMVLQAYRELKRYSDQKYPQQQPEMQDDNIDLPNDEDDMDYDDDLQESKKKAISVLKEQFKKFK